MTEILKCTCEHEYQDKKYGDKMRVMNMRGGNKLAQPTYRCTVCKKERQK